MFLLSANFTCFKILSALLLVCARLRTVAASYTILVSDLLVSLFLPSHLFACSPPPAAVVFYSEHLFPLHVFQALYQAHIACSHLLTGYCKLCQTQIQVHWFSFPNLLKYIKLMWNILDNPIIISICIRLKLKISACFFRLFSLDFSLRLIMIMGLDIGHHRKLF